MTTGPSLREACLVSLNIGSPKPDAGKRNHHTGIDKRPVERALEVFAPGPKGNGSGLSGDFVGDGKYHGGDDQALYAFAREDLDRWQAELGYELASGSFGENLTTVGLDVNEARLGERWRIGATAEFVVRDVRIPCNTFKAKMNERGWLKRFTGDARPGAYLAVAVPGEIRAGDPIVITHRPPHDVTVSLVFRALTLEAGLLPRLLAAGDDLNPDLRAAAQAGGQR